jgi:cyanate lyase
MPIDHQADPKGDRVKIGMTGKLLPLQSYGASRNAQQYGW